MTTYYHLADPSYSAGQDLFCFDELEAMGCAPAWKWDDCATPIDTEVVCLFSSREEAEEMRDEWLPEGILLRVELPESPREYGLQVTRVSEGYTAVVRRIPAEYITVEA